VRRIKAKHTGLKTSAIDSLRAECKRYNQDMRNLGLPSLQKPINDYIAYKYGRYRSKSNTNIKVEHDPQAQPLYRRQETHIPSMNSDCMVAGKPEERVYTGTVVKGLGTMHKSNTTVVINDTVAKDMATMRRG
jgi:hypothetical protein